jgi:hypothetical protein
MTDKLAKATTFPPLKKTVVSMGMLSPDLISNIQLAKHFHAETREQQDWNFHSNAVED